MYVSALSSSNSRPTRMKSPRAASWATSPLRGHLARQSVSVVLSRKSSVPMSERGFLRGVSAEETVETGARHCQRKVEMSYFGSTSKLDRNPPFPVLTLYRAVLAVKGSHSPRNNRAPLATPRRSESDTEMREKGVRKSCANSTFLFCGDNGRAALDTFVRMELDSASKGRPELVFDTRP